MDTVKIARHRAAAGLALSLSLVLAACSSGAGNGESTGPGAASTSGTQSSGSLSGTINGSGASSQVNAQQAWRDNFTAATGAVVNYDATGSGTGREQFLAGKVDYAGTDSALKEDEVAAATERCGGESPIEVPLYISPIAIAFNLDGIDSVNMSADVIAKIFKQEITNWNDPAIAKLNDGVKLPDMPIIPVNRADDSGTSKNFQQYLVESSGEWDYKPEDTWPITGTQSAEKTSGVVNLVSSTPGAITYADASQIGDLGTVAVEVAGDFLAYSPEAAAAIVDNSAPAPDATDRILTVDLKRDGSVKGAYPVVLVSYLVACTHYDNADTASVVKEYFTYMASQDGQKIAAEANGGNAPISDTLRKQVMAAVDQIKTN
ncbi:MULTISPECIES: phosphate ABC transporter substrate-binding protein PstS [Trueperella]|uniref:phosphate ABC transporter substrate-binding protein PstS n=1 Tax=Trueperella TaxID=1069494 RepID=UPI0027D8DBEB|nr:MULTISPECIES: phosphate ABC transporter substrate-binding protein PstS [Trueperella]MDY5403247.1 phosphate ABC transporter substrate-binding protein PstS [Trueperella sp.]